MATAAEDLYEKALQLPAADEAAVDESWSQETARRAQMIETGEARLVTWDHLQERIHERRSSSSSG